MSAYDGTNYHGFQRQENALAIQQVIEEAAEKILGEKVTVIGCSRTDTGVHAREFCISFRHNSPITCDGMLRAFNSLLPDDIAMLSCDEAHENFHARFDCAAKEYVYEIYNSRIKNPFLKSRALLYGPHLDEALLNETAQLFVGTHDFKSFCSVHTAKKSTVRTIHRFEVTRDEKFVRMLVKGDGFLYNMVRILVGTLIYVNEGKFTPLQIKEILDLKDRTRAGKTAPAHGLYLNKVYYDV
jgi:tRNA pseudouridine38-40 synthase